MCTALFLPLSRLLDLIPMCACWGRGETKQFSDASRVSSYPPLQMPVNKPQAVAYSSGHLHTVWKFQWSSPLGLINLLEQLTEIKETLTCTTLLKYILKNTNQQPDEETDRARSQKKELLSLKSLGPGSVACGSILVPQTWKLSRKKRKRKKKKGLKAILLHFYEGFIT